MLNKTIINQLLETAQNNDTGYFKFDRIGDAERIILGMDLGKLEIIERDGKCNFVLNRCKYNRVDLIDGVPESDLLNLFSNLKKDASFSDLLDKICFTFR